MQTYVETRDGDYFIAGKRISLDSVVYAFRRGESPESIIQSFPLLTLEEVYGAITFYLANEEAIDAYLVADEAKSAEFDRNLRDADDWYLRMQKARQEMLAPQV
jgi:uncharacterized protein (DUF433 family)